MTRRGIFAGFIATIGAIFLDSKRAIASENWTVPDGVNLIRVKSFRNGKLVMDTSINVTPGQVFTIDVVK